MAALYYEMRSRGFYPDSDDNRWKISPARLDFPGSIRSEVSILNQSVGFQRLKFPVTDKIG